MRLESSMMLRKWSILLFAQAVLGSLADKERESLLPVPKRDLEWGDVNFIATSDTHGWLLGHQHATWPEPNYSGDYGDLASFVEHMREIASSEGSDLLLVDCGDHHDGSGLVSSSASGASRADDIFNQLKYDIITIGNHELYSYAVAKTIYEQAKDMGGRYLTSNVNITVSSDEGKAISVPIGERHRKFTTAQGRKVTAFGVIFDFQAHDHNLTIQSPLILSREAWFSETISEAPDYFVLAGHQPVRGEGAEWAPVYDTIRARHPLVPIFIFGGHTHVRDCTQYDDRSIAVVPGRYLETATFVSSDLPSHPSQKGPLKMNRRYIDSNRVSYQFHSRTNSTTFDTSLGMEITSNLLNLASALNISTPQGIAPHDLYLARYPYGHKRSLLTVWNDEVLPLTVVDKERKGARIIIGNTGSLRFELFAGRFDRNDELTISPFKTKLQYICLPAKFALSITPEMNRLGASKCVPSPAISSFRSELDLRRMRYEDDLRVKREYHNWLAGQREEYEGSLNMEEMGGEQQIVIVDDGWRGKHGLTLGYVTKDACPGKGDDIEHIPLPHSRNQPDFSQTPFDIESISDSDDEIDVVVMDFALDDFITAVHALRPGSNLTVEDFEPYAEGTSIDTLWGDFARLKW